MKKITLLLLIITGCAYSQNLNTYKFALVPSKFSFLKEANLYNLNVLAKLYMIKYGFDTYMDNESYSTDFAQDNCNKVFIDVVNSSTMFTTKLSVVVKDCKNTIICTSQEGKSNEKDYKLAYTLALREAFDSFNVLKNHVYSTQKILGMIGEPVLQEMPIQPKISLYIAQKTSLGFDLHLSDNEIITIILLQTSNKDVFLAKKNNSFEGVFFRKDKEWFFEYYQNDKLVSEKVSVWLN